VKLQDLIIIIETVGVGQSRPPFWLRMVDSFYFKISGAGDEPQEYAIMEMAMLLLLTKRTAIILIEPNLQNRI
jgi:putative protein kinase ArgK-like GTPase of G3E family